MCKTSRKKCLEDSIDVYKRQLTHTHTHKASINSFVFKKNLILINLLYFDAHAYLYPTFPRRRRKSPVIAIVSFNV